METSVYEKGIFIMAKKNGAIIGYGGMGGWHGEFLRNSDVVNLMGTPVLTSRGHSFIASSLRPILCK